MLEYSILIQYDKSDNIYVASIPELRGCMAHGDSPEDAAKEIKIAFKLWMETAKEEGVKIPVPMLHVS